MCVDVADAAGRKSTAPENKAIKHTCRGRQLASPSHAPSQYHHCQSLGLFRIPRPLWSRAGRLSGAPGTRQGGLELDAGSLSGHHDGGGLSPRAQAAHVEPWSRYRATGTSVFLASNRDVLQSQNDPLNSVLPAWRHHSCTG